MSVAAADGITTTAAAAVPGDGAPASSAGEVVPYEAEFFDRYRPVTALDMLDRVPGFQLDEGGGSRGFGGAAGNVLINGERPSTKNDSAADILGRTPAGQVARIDLIRGQAGGLDLRGQAVAVNVILREEGAAVRWESGIGKSSNNDTFTPAGSVSLTSQWGATRYTAGLESGKDFRRQDGVERLLIGEAGRLGEERFEFNKNKGYDVEGNLNTETRLGTKMVHVNFRSGVDNFEGFEHSRREPRSTEAPFTTVIEGNENDTFFLEVGADVELPVRDEVTAKGIVLFNYADSSGDSSERTLDAGGNVTEFTRAPRDGQESESIGRLELDWTRFARHRLEASFEGAFNTLENSLTLFEDTGAGEREIPLPGANTRVEEIRGDFEFTDSWTLGAFTIDSGVAWEVSNISQSGDVGNERTFFFTKPRLMLSYAPVTARQIRFRFQREVAQLDFNDFVSATNFGDNQVDFGNPDLSPENTWVTELALEQRFGEIGALILTGFHHWINDVQDELPLGGIFEVPGNIGDGRRWGMEAEATFPLERLGIIGGRLDFQARWQDSMVEDPVTGRSRVLSGEREFDTRIEFRQDLEAIRIAWGWALMLESETPSFGLDEFVETDDVAETIDMDLYVETTRWLGVKTQFRFGNIFDRTFRRDRRVFQGPRDLSPLAFREVRERDGGVGFEITVSGSF